MIRYLLAVLMACVCTLAQAGFIAKHGENWVRGGALPCTDEKVLAAITSTGEVPADFRAGSAQIGGQIFQACWKPDFKEQKVYLRYEDGDKGYLNFDEMVEEPGV